MSFCMQRQDNITIAKFAESAERHDDMLAAMKLVADSVEASGDLSIEERNLFSIAFKNVVGAKRLAWRIVLNIDQNAIDNVEFDRVMVQNYREKIEAEVKILCTDVVNILDSRLISQASSHESKVFYLKMKGDYYRYLAELSSSSARPCIVSDAEAAYQLALEISTLELLPTNTIRLGLALNFSVFFFEILNVPERACLLAKQAFDDAIPELESLNEEAYRDSTLIMQLLRDNLMVFYYFLCTIYQEFHTIESSQFELLLHHVYFARPISFGILYVYDYM